MLSFVKVFYYNIVYIWQEVASVKKWCCVLMSLALMFGLTGCDLGSGAGNRPNRDETQATTAPLDYLAEGYYVLESGTWQGGNLKQEALLPLRCYIQIDHHGTGLVSACDVAMILVWDESGIRIEGEYYLYTVGDNVLTLTGDNGILRFRYAGEVLPEMYLPAGPQPGCYVVSAVIREGEREEYATLRTENGYLELLENGTGVLCFDGVTQRLTWDGDGLYTMDGTVLYLYSPVDGLLTLYLAEGLALELRPGRSSN